MIDKETWFKSTDLTTVISPLRENFYGKASVKSLGASNRNVLSIN